jgi:hypothetical protein
LGQCCVAVGNGTFVMGGEMRGAKNSKEGGPSQVAGTRCGEKGETEKKGERGGWMDG